MSARLTVRLKIPLVLLASALILFVSRSLWLSWIGYALVHDDGPCKADMAVVLAGDLDGQRLSKAVELLRAGYVPLILISGPDGYYGKRESDLALEWAKQQGYPESSLIPLPNSARSTQEEALIVLGELRRRHVGSFVLVTSNFHIARARRIYLAAERKQGMQLHMQTVAAPDRYFSPNSWWRGREGEKIAFFEWSKTIANVFGI